jgi:septal ring factor EnvC (AmiA/AmiB activator)|uniref:At3g28370 n=2 Tax=Arabidopsis thaliana TaxID=3702 RepID=Q84MC4_ARATH|nr:At3g28370 [Arabidopsis thaliana]
MEELNKEIREFQKTVDSSLSSDDGIGITANVKASEDGSGADLEAIKGMLSEVNSQLAKEEEGYLAEQKIQEQLQKELDDYEKKMSLMEAITDKTNSVQVLTRQTSELEQTLASLGEELQRRCRCQHCEAENLEVLSLLLQGDQDMEVS